MLETKAIDHAIQLALRWLLASIAATGGKGSAVRYHLWRGWSEAYPETTGYLIETLFDNFHLTKIEALRATALQCADWLCELQHPNGAFPGGVGGKLPPIVFDTGMIVFGLTRAWEETNEEKYRTALHKAVTWLEKGLHTDSPWLDHTYVPGYVPSYYTMVIWAMLEANKHLKINGLQEKLERTLDFFLKKTTPAHSIQDWSFRPGEQAFTHTIAYTLQGLLEAGLLLKNQDALSTVRVIAEKMQSIRQEKGKLAGCYDEQWRGDYSFGCLTGQAQMSLVFFRLYEVFKEPAYSMEAQTLLWQNMKFQSTVKLDGWEGGIPGSAPIWGKYQRFSFPNWAVKFFLDGCLTARKLIAQSPSSRTRL